ncbi:TonB-dependent receptor plug domain-containing protein [Methylobacillus flagellatus]|uniref:TonB-dependent receptor plug domain-containing protein n=1 Tax=Methylobacillus flagellatus TaxID=405 RepID=UPI0018A14610|nr:TonB-dependent receptor plug domain-containing protein [Methylobacillus flagellatus]
MIKKPMMGMAVLILTMPAFAAEQANQKNAASNANEESIVADKVKVTSILPDRLEAVPGSFNVVDEKELKARQPFSVREALNQTPGINIVGEDAFVLAPNIGIRGLNPRRTSRTLLMEDGVPLFLAPYGDPSAHYTTPLDRVNRIEVVKGSGQTLYGPQTVGGMINFVTKPVPKEFQASVMAIIGNNNFSGGHVNIGTGGDWGGIMLDAVNRKGDGIRDNHDFEVNELTLKGQLNLDERNTLITKLGWYEENSSISETGLGLVEYNEDKYQAPTGKQDYFNHERKSMQLKHIFQVSDKAKLSTQFYYVKSEAQLKTGYTGSFSTILICNTRLAYVPSPRYMGRTINNKKGAVNMSFKHFNNFSLSNENTPEAIDWLLEVGWHYTTMQENEAMQIARVNRTTWGRWRKGQIKIPPATLELLRLHAFGHTMCNLHRQWDDFRFRRDALITPDGREMRPADLKAVFVWKQMCLYNRTSAERQDIYNRLRLVYGDNYQHAIA